ncbi:MAS20-domain-containing protein [Hymenopellis radicata]|nr:MAS20-domain-containing protein [Hymenopellis radicata]
MSSRTTTVLTVASLAAAGLIAYAVYFDYKRRNDGDFRKKLRKDKKRVEKIASSQVASETSSSGVSAAELVDALERLKKEEPPLGPAERENYFMSQVATGEQLASQGPAFNLPSALAFYRALRVYPSPVELMVIYEKTVPEAIFKLVIQMTQLDMYQKVQGYYNEFPPKSTNVSVKDIDGNKTAVVNQDFKKGDVIYKECPVVAALDADLQTTGTYCSHCLRLIESSIAIKSPQDPLSQTYCSKACQLDSKTQSHNLLFTTERPLPAEIPMELPPPEALERRRKAQTEYVEHLKKGGKAGPLLVGRFVARQINAETLKLVPGVTTEKPSYIDTDGDDYGLGDHIERLKYIDVPTVPEDHSLLANVLGAAVPDLNQFITDERMVILLGKMAYNAYGVSFGGGREDKPPSSERPEDQERTRTPYGTSRQIGSAFYTLSSYLTHSCEPSARPSFSGGTSELHLIANQDLKAGDELTVAFVDVVQHEGESVEDCRRRRRMELARGWRFACDCARCAREAEGQVDESKVEASVVQAEQAQAA